MYRYDPGTTPTPARRGDSRLGRRESAPADPGPIEKAALAGGATAPASQRRSQEGQNRLASAAGNNDDVVMDRTATKNGNEVTSRAPAYWPEPERIAGPGVVNTMFRRGRVAERASGQFGA